MKIYSEEELIKAIEDENEKGEFNLFAIKCYRKNNVLSFKIEPSISCGFILGKPNPKIGECIDNLLYELTTLAEKNINGSLKNANKEG